MISLGLIHTDQCGSADTTALLEILKVVAAGSVGALSAILAQYLSNKSAERRHQRELEQRATEMWSVFLSPIAARRIQAYEDCYDTIQEAIETSRLNMNDYLKVRRVSVYLPSSIRSSLMQSLSSLLNATRAGQQPEAMQAINRLKEVQNQLQTELGATTISEKLKSLFEET